MYTDDKTKSLAYKFLGRECELVVFDAGQGGVYRLRPKNRNRKITVIQGCCVINGLPLQHFENIEIPEEGRFVIHAVGTISFLCEY